MNNKLSLSIAKPCSERWEHFTPDARGGFCNACNKSVVDFTKMSDEEILAFFNHRSAQSCGRFRPDQLKAYSAKTTPVTYFSRHWVQTTFLGLLMFLGNKQAYPQSPSEKTVTPSVHLQDIVYKSIAGEDGQMIKGTVTDEYHQSLPGVSILIKGTTVGTATDIAGHFEFPQKLAAGDVLIFSFIGFQHQEYVVGKDASSGIKIALIMDHMHLMGEVVIERPKPTGIAKWWQKVKSVF